MRKVYCWCIDYTLNYLKDDAKNSQTPKEVRNEMPSGTGRVQLCDTNLENFMCPVRGKLAQVITDARRW